MQLKVNYTKWLEDSFTVLTKLSTVLPYNPATRFQGIYLNDLQIYAYTNEHKCL